MPGREIDPNDIAALVEGKLVGTERERVIQQLADSEDAYRVFVEAMAETHGLADKEEWEADEKSIRSVRHSRLEKIRRKLAQVWDTLERTAIRTVIQHPGYASLPVVAVILTLVMLPMLRPGPVSVTDVVAAVDASRLSGGWQEPLWPVVRGGATRAGPRLSFRVGVRLTDLQVAVRLGDAAITRRLAAEVDSMIAEIPFSQLILLTHRRITDGLEAGATADTLSARVADVESLLQQSVDEPSLEYGTWLESARLAALAGDSAFFASEASRDLLKRIRRTGSAAIQQQISTVDALIRDGPRLREIEEAVTAIIEASGI